MTGPRDPDAIIANWLEDGPIDLPDETRRAIVVGLRTQPRARPVAILRGLPIMNSLSRLVAAAAIVLAVGGLAIFALSNRNGGGPGAQPSTTPAPSVAPSASVAPSPSTSPSIAPTPSASPLSTAAWLPFTSTQYGYQIAYPPTWTAERATRNWVFATDRLTVPLSGQADHFLGGPNGNQVGVSGWAADVPVGTSEDAWLTSYYQNDAGAGVNCGVTTATLLPTIVDGHPGRIATSTCDDTQAFVFIGSRVYVFAIWRGETDPSVQSYGGARRLLDAFLSTVTFQAVSPSPS
jgi:hypothetical protein